MYFVDGYIDILTHAAYLPDIGPSRSRSSEHGKKTKADRRPFMLLPPIIISMLIWFLIGV